MAIILMQPKWVFVRSLYLCVLAIFLSVIPSFSLAQESVTIHGSSTVTGAIINAYGQKIEDSAKIKLDVLTSSSGRGLEALIKGESDVAMISSDLNALWSRIDTSLIKNHEKDDYNIYYLGQAKLLFIVAMDSPVHHLSRKQIIQILRGDVTEWSVFGYPDLGHIRLITEKPTGGMYTMLEKEFLKTDVINAAIPMTLQTAPQVPVIVQHLPNAIGLYSSAMIAQTTENVRVLNTPDLRVGQPLLFVTHKLRENEAVKRTINVVQSLTR